jgi:two-component system, cell cycle sensor histidine kinase and response regulator CckA
MTQAGAAKSTWERTLLESVNDVIYSVDGDVFSGQVTFVNGQVERILGYRPQDFVDDATLWIRNIHPDDLPRLIETTRTMMANAAPVSRIFRVRHRDGNRFVWFEDRVVPQLGPDGRVRGILGVARDVTARREAEIELERSLRRVERLYSVGLFTGGIAHDLSNIFTVLISGYAESAAGRQNPTVDKLRASLQDAARRGYDLTKRLLAFARGEQTRARRIDLNAVTADMVVLLRRIVGVDVEIVTELAPSLAPVRGDPTQIQQVILNLAANARDAMEKGGRLTIATLNVGEEECAVPAPGPEQLWVAMRVGDTGAGMDAETRRQIFEPFFTTKADGTGLGLAIVKQIVTEMGGHIRVESEPGRGTTFEILLPPHSENGGS